MKSVPSIAQPWRRVRWLLGALACSALVLGCSSSESKDSGAAGSAGAAGGGGSGGSAGSSAISCEDSSELALDGTFALLAKLNFTFGSQEGGAVSVCPKDQTSDGTFLGLMRIKHTPGSTQIQELEAVVCTLELPVISALAGQCSPNAPNLVYAGLTFPQALIDAFPVTVTAHSSATLDKVSPGAAFSAQALNFALGTKATGALAPLWQMNKPGCGAGDLAEGRSQQCSSTCVSDCSQLSDDDKDGWPGVTVQVCGYTNDDKQDQVVCQADEPNHPGATIQGRALMNLQVAPLTLSGQAPSSCELSGGLDAQILYNVIGADLYVANAQISVTSAIKSLPTYQVNRQQSRFRAVRIDGQHGAPNWNPDFSNPLATCRTVIARQNELK